MIVIRTRQPSRTEYRAAAELDDLKGRVGEILNRWAAVCMVVGVVRDGHLDFFSGNCVADIASNTPITEL